MKVYQIISIVFLFLLTLLCTKILIQGGLNNTKLDKVLMILDEIKSTSESTRLEWKDCQKELINKGLLKEN